MVSLFSLQRQVALWIVAFIENETLEVRIPKIHMNANGLELDLAANAPSGRSVSENFRAVIFMAV